jgi:hypothetical protein
MATTDAVRGKLSEQFDVDLTKHGFSTPPNVYVELSANYVGDYLAVIAAGPAGHYSLDFGVDQGSVEIARAHADGSQCEIDELPAWMDAVVDDIERELP